MTKILITSLAEPRQSFFILLIGLIISQTGLAQTPDEPIVGIQKTGQIACWGEDGVSVTCANTGQDGELQKGVAEPTQRCINNNNGTITDRMTGLTWLANNSCMGTIDQNWANRLLSADVIASGSCGLSDGSLAGDWRAPNINELLSTLKITSDGLDIAFDCGLTLANESLWSSTSTPGAIGYVGNAPLILGAGAQSAYTYSPVSKSISTSLRSPVPRSISVWPVRGASKRSNAIVPTVTTNQRKCWSVVPNILGNRDPISCIGTRADGELQAGLDRPRPRFRMQADFIFEDRLTGLVWLDATQCAQKKSWGDALDLAANMYDGATSDDIDPAGDCGLTDGSAAGDWRIPNLFEVLSLMDISEIRFPTFYQGYHGESVSFNNFSNAGFPSEMVLTLGTFWTSTTVGDNTTAAYTIGGDTFDAISKFFDSETKTDLYQVLMVRDPN